MNAELREPTRAGLLVEQELECNATKACHRCGYTFNDHILVCPNCTEVVRGSESCMWTQFSKDSVAPAFGPKKWTEAPVKLNSSVLDVGGDLDDDLCEARGFQNNATIFLIWLIVFSLAVISICR